MARRNWYRPQRKADLIRHLEETHPAVKSGFYRQTGWTVKALAENHDGLHEERKAEWTGADAARLHAAQEGND